ncbi:MAG: 4a-hydroxytetrahydrobiopterin dehydratase [Nitrospiraceae bacterium]
MQPFTFFISYRREHTAPVALLLKYELEKRLQFVRVFVDVEEIHQGMNFPTRIKELIDQAHATIVLIGKNWMPRRDPTDTRVGQPGNTAEQGSQKWDRDWVVAELMHSAASPIAYEAGNLYDRKARAILPIFNDCERGFDQFDIPEPLTNIAYTHAESIDSANWPVAIGPLIERIAVNLGLKKRPDKDEYPKPDAAKARTQPVPDQELLSILKYDDYDGWYLDNFGNTDMRYLVKTFEFPHFNQAAQFMEMVSNHCRILDHHPEWRNVFNHVTVALSTWDAKRQVTIYDLNLALFMNKAARVVTVK